LNSFDALILKIIFKKIKIYPFDAFQHEKYFEKQPKTTLLKRLFPIIL